MSRSPAICCQSAKHLEGADPHFEGWAQTNFEPWDGKTASRESPVEGPPLLRSIIGNWLGNKTADHRARKLERPDEFPPIVGSFLHSAASRGYTPEFQKVEFWEVLQEISSTGQHSLKTAESPGAPLKEPANRLPPGVPSSSEVPRFDRSDRAEGRRNSSRPKRGSRTLSAVGAPGKRPN